MSKTNDTSTLDHDTLADSELDAVTGGADDIFTRYGGIQGESTEKNHKDWVSILRWW